MKISSVLPPSSFLWKCQGEATPVRGVQITARLNLESQQPRVSPLSPRKKRKKNRHPSRESKKKMRGIVRCTLCFFYIPVVARDPPAAKAKGGRVRRSGVHAASHFAIFLWYAGNLWNKAKFQFSYCTFATATFYSLKKNYLIDQVAQAENNFMERRYFWRKLVHDSGGVGRGITFFLAKQKQFVSFTFFVAFPSS